MALNTGVIGGYNGVNITAAAPTTTVVKTGQGILGSVIFNLPVATGVVTIYDNTAASGTIIATITEPSGVLPHGLTYNIHFKTGLTVVTSVAAQDITVTYI